MKHKKEESKSAELYRKAAEQEEAKTLNDSVKRNGLTEYTLSDSVTEIGVGAFRGCGLTRR